MNYCRTMVRQDTLKKPKRTHTSLRDALIKGMGQLLLAYDDDYNLVKIIHVYDPETDPDNVPATPAEFYTAWAELIKRVHPEFS